MRKLPFLWVVCMAEKLTGKSQANEVNIAWCFLRFSAVSIQNLTILCGKAL